MMRTVLYMHQNQFYYGLILEEDDVNNVITIAPMELSAAVGVGWRICGMPSLKFTEGKTVKIEKTAIHLDILILRQKYLDEGYARYHRGMLNVFFIADSDLKGHENAFFIQLFEPAKKPFIIPSTPIILQLHLDKCNIITALHKAITNSGGVSEISVKLIVSPAMANLFIMMYPQDGMVTDVKPIQYNPAALYLHDVSYLDRLKCKASGWEIRTLKTLATFRELLSENATWVCNFFFFFFISIQI